MECVRVCVCACVCVCVRVRVRVRVADRIPNVLPPPPSAQCPFGFTGPNPHGPSKAENAQKKPSKDAAHDDGARCPWPFIFFHDPGQGMKDWQTWAVIGMAAAFIYNRHASAV